MSILLKGGRREVQMKYFFLADVSICNGLFFEHIQISFFDLEDMLMDGQFLECTKGQLT